jgi:GTP-binding protein Era
MVAAAWTGSQDADLSLLLVDAQAGLTPQVRAIAQRLAEQQRRTWFVLNKIDLCGRPALLPLIEQLTALLPAQETYMISAGNGDGVEELVAALAIALPEGPHLYPDDELTDMPDRLLAAELVREQVFLQTHEEVPYGTTVETEGFDERPDGSVRVDATIYVARAGQKAILIGEGGTRIKSIGAKARGELSRLLDRTVHLFLNVKERTNWDDERARLRAINLEDPD